MGIYNFHPDHAEDFARFMGIRYVRRDNELILMRCPYCREQTKDKFKFSINLKTGQFQCFRASCGAKGNMITLSKHFNYELPGYADEYVNTRKRYASLPQNNKPVATDPAIEYLKGRGITEEVVKKYQITTAKDNPHHLLFPFYDENNTLQLIKYRNTAATKENGQAKEWSYTDKEHGLSCKPILFGMNHCSAEESDTLILTEGQIDSLSVASAGIPNAVSVPTGARGFTWIPYCWDFMSKFKKMIVFGDHEKGHITLLEDMRKVFQGILLHVREEDYKDCKDANDILRKYGKEQIRICIENAIPIENAKIIRLSEIKKSSVNDMEKISTGIQTLDKTIGGLYFGQLIVLTGERGEGKSTLVNQLALFSVRAGIKTFVYSGELGNENLREWIDIQAAGSRHLDVFTSNFGITYSVVKDSAVNAITDWYRDYLWAYRNDFADDDEEETTISMIESAVTQGFRFVIVDNLMTAMDDDLTADLNRSQTVFIKKLSRIAKSKNIIIILIAHQRKKTGMADRDSDDVSGSANITNLADVVLAFGKPKKDEEGSRTLTVLKNRLFGKRERIPMYYQESSRRLSDMPNFFDWEMGWEQNVEFSTDTDVDNPFALED